ncbi:N-acetylglucosamine-6-phosphate deacetylase [Paenibacillus sp. CC-CFT747]|nr:N-acetylglucosamine-6-phosphate deacetylase [Paenibacillus sp. CC-CFT747]
MERAERIDGLIRKGNVVLPESTRYGADVRLRNGRIAEIGEALPCLEGETVMEAEGAWVFPGFLDLHVHGGDGAGVSDGDPRSLARMCAFHARHGTTGLLLTTSTLPDERLTEALEAVRAYASSEEESMGAEALGVHLEGPFLSEAYRGAQNPEWLQAPCVEKARRWMKASGDRIRLVTLAPELPGAQEVISFFREKGAVVSAGHSGADYDRMEQALREGITHSTHFYNGMPGFHHRRPGIAASVWLNDEVSAELILDLQHVHPAAAQVLLRCKGLNRVCLITDAVHTAGLPDGEYWQASGRKLTVREGTVRLESGELAGSMLTMNRAVRHAVQALGLAPHEAARLASLTPAEIIGEERERGSLSPGKRADLVLLDANYDVLLTLREGVPVYRKSD